MSQLMTEFILNSLDNIIADRSILCVGISISSIETFSYFDDTPANILPLIKT